MSSDTVLDLSASSRPKSGTEDSSRTKSATVTSDDLTISGSGNTANADLDRQLYISIEDAQKSATLQAEQNPRSIPEVAESCPSGLIFYPCAYCTNQEFNKILDLENHMYSKHLGKFFKCGFCMEIYQMKWNMFIHLSKQSCFRTTSASPSSSPSILSSTFPKESVSEPKGTQISRRAKIIVMYTCRTEIIKGIECIKYSCNFCPAVYNRKNLLLSHLILHSRDKSFDVQSRLATKFQCKICERCFTSQKTLETHVASHSNRPPQKCFFCNKLFHTKGEFLAHQRLKICKAFLNCAEEPPKTDLPLQSPPSKHRSVHKKSPTTRRLVQFTEEHLRQNRSSIFCEHCNLNFDSEVGLEMHFSNSSCGNPSTSTNRQSSSAESFKTTDSANSNKYQCIHCPKSFKTQIGLDIHIEFHSIGFPSVVGSVEELLGCSDRLGKKAKKSSSEEKRDEVKLHTKTKSASSLRKGKKCVSVNSTKEAVSESEPSTSKSEKVTRKIVKKRITRAV